MSRTLRRRLAKLEKTLNKSGEWYVLCTESWDTVSYDILPSSKLNGNYACTAGPFKSRRDAHAWRFRELQTNYPKALERLLQERSPKEVEATLWLTVDTCEEFVEEMLRTDIDLNTLSESDRKTRQTYLDHPDEARALIAKHHELLRGGFQ